MRLVCVQPRSGYAEDESRNATEAVAWLDDAAAAGAQLVVFPEGYPGPTNPMNEYDAFTPLAKRAGELGVYVIAGRIEPADDGRHYVTLHLIDDHGETLGVWRRFSPRGPYLYKDSNIWNCDYRESDELPRVWETPLGNISMLVCSEIFVPELSRIAATNGADIIVYPAGGAIHELLPGWRVMPWARAQENLVYTAVTQNIYDDEQGVGTIAGPEGIITQSAEPGQLIADLDLDRLKFLRTREPRIETPKPYAVTPGVSKWRRPEQYAEVAYR
jgi:predicted amidohydrolase